MKYFAKWLPVKDAPCIGAIIFNKDNNRLAEITSWDNTMGFTFIKYLDDGDDGLTDLYEVVKLHLCTHECDEGDNVFVEPQALELYNKGITFTFKGVVDKDYVSFVYKTHPNMPGLIGKDREAWPAQNVFKSIGPISDKAIWIKEYDTFEEDDWELWPKSGVIEAKDKTIPAFKEHLKNPDRYVKLKCPTCKTFH